jgi:hypothetical protein
MSDLTRSCVRARAIPHSVAIPKLLTYFAATAIRFFALGAVGGLQHAKIELSPGRELQTPQRRKEFIVGARDRRRHVNESEGVVDRLHKRIGKLDHLAGPA